MSETYARIMDPKDKLEDLIETKSEELGRLVREEWVAFAKEQPNPKPNHLVGWDELDPMNRAIDCRIGAALYLKGVDESDERRAMGALVILGWEVDAFEGHLDKCSPSAMRRILELLEPDTGDERKEQLSVYARKEINRRLNALSDSATAVQVAGLEATVLVHEGTIKAVSRQRNKLLVEIETTRDDLRQLAQHVVDTSDCIYAGAAGGKRGECRNYDDGPCCYCRALAFLEPR